MAAEQVITKGNTIEEVSNNPDETTSNQQLLLKRQSGTASIKKLSVDYNISLYDDGKIFINMTAKSTATFYSRFSLRIVFKDADAETLHSIITPIKDVKVGSTEQYNELEQIPRALAMEVAEIQVGGSEEGVPASSGMTNEKACIVL